MTELELTDEDVLDAMRQIQGYLDISTEDFRAIYHLAHAHALARTFDRIRAGDLMLTGVAPVQVTMCLREAAEQLVAQGRKSLPVVGDRGVVVGVLTETDFPALPERGFGAGPAVAAGRDGTPGRPALRAHVGG